MLPTSNMESLPALQSYPSQLWSLCIILLLVINFFGFLQILKVAFQFCTVHLRKFSKWLLSARQDKQGRQATNEVLDQYINETILSIYVIEYFCAEQKTWSQKRQQEVKQMQDINSKATCKDFKTIMKNAVNGEHIRQELEKELGTVLQNTLEGLDELEYFLEAVEKLAVTSAFAFPDDQQLPLEANAADVCLLIEAAKMAAPLLIHFKRNNAAFFLPSLSNAEILAFQLEKYIDISKKICEVLQKRGIHCIIMSEDISVPEKTNHDHLDELTRIRTNPDLRLTLLFQEKAKTFIDEYNERCTRLEEYISDLEKEANKLDNMKRGASISTIVGSSVGVAGGILSIVGIALAPVTAGVSLALTVAGVSLGVTSGANSLATGITNAAVNSRCGSNAKNTFMKLMEDMEGLNQLLEIVANESPARRFMEGERGLEFEVLRVGNRVRGIASNIESIVDGAAAVRVLQTEEVAENAVRLGLQHTKTTKSVPNLAADLPDIGQLAKGTPLALSKAARAGLISLNVLFIGLDVFFICKESISLSKGKKSELAQMIRARVDLWRSEIESWKMIHDSLVKEISNFRESQSTLNKHFSPNIV